MLVGLPQCPLGSGEIQKGFVYAQGLDQRREFVEDREHLRGYLLVALAAHRHDDGLRAEPPGDHHRLGRMAPEGPGFVAGGGAAAPRPLVADQQRFASGDPAARRRRRRRPCRDGGCSVAVPPAALYRLQAVAGFLRRARAKQQQRRNDNVRGANINGLHDGVNYWAPVTVSL